MGPAPYKSDPVYGTSSQSNPTGYEAVTLIQAGQVLSLKKFTSQPSSKIFSVVGDSTRLIRIGNCSTIRFTTIMFVATTRCQYLTNTLSESLWLMATKKFVANKKSAKSSTSLAFYNCIRLFESFIRRNKR